MDLKSLTPQLAGVLRDMGVSYDPHRLADALKGKQLDVTARGAQVLPQTSSLSIEHSHGAALCAAQAGRGQHALPGAWAQLWSCGA